MVDFEIEFEVNPEYNAHCVRITEAILKEFGKQIAYIKLIPSHEGKFDVSVDGEITYTLMWENRLPKVEELTAMVHERLRSTGRL